MCLRVCCLHTAVPGPGLEVSRSGHKQLVFYVPGFRCPFQELGEASAATLRRRLESFFRLLGRVATRGWRCTSKSHSIEMLMIPKCKVGNYQKHANCYAHPTKIEHVFDWTRACKCSKHDLFCIPNPCFGESKSNEQVVSVGICHGATVSVGFGCCWRRFWDVCGLSHGRAGQEKVIFLKI